MDGPTWTLSSGERRVLEAALDALLPPDGSFPVPSETRLIDDFIRPRVPAAGDAWVSFPWIDADALKAILHELAAGTDDITGALAKLEQSTPSRFLALWRLAVYGYYSRPETIAAIQRDLGVVYHGAPLPLGYPDVLPRFDPTDPLQLPVNAAGAYIATESVARQDVTRLLEEFETQ